MEYQCVMESGNEQGAGSIHHRARVESLHEGPEDWPLWRDFTVAKIQKIRRDCLGVARLRAFSGTEPALFIK